MKFTVKVDGADQSLIARLVAAANRKLAPKLARYAKRPKSSSGQTAPNPEAVAVGAILLGGVAVATTTSTGSLQSGSTASAEAVGEDTIPSGPDVASDASDASDET